MPRKKLDFSNPVFAQEEPTAKAQDAPAKKPTGRPRNPELIRIEDGGSSTQAGLTEEYQRFSVILKVSNVEDIKNYSYTHRIPIKDATDEIIEKFFQDYRNNPANEPILDRRKGTKK